jgi:DNA-directed RNA polymerase subunit RPC12/RpoP
MDTENVEIECPVCDQRIKADAPRCPHCGAEFTLSGVDELEMVAREINGRPAPENLKAKAGPIEAQPAVAASAEKEEDKNSKGFLGKLFRKRR